MVFGVFVNMIQKQIQIDSPHELKANEHNRNAFISFGKIVIFPTRKIRGI
jgi:hypothetical protein